VKVGTRGSLEDGRVFYYARSSGASIAAGSLLQSELVDEQNEDRAVNTAQIGDRSITVSFGTTTADANDYAGGYVCVIDADGEGVTYQIDQHPAVTSGGSIAITLVDPIYLAFEDATTVTIVKNPWMDVVIASGTSALVPPAGVPSVTVPAGTTTAQYFWSQTWGVASVKQGSTGLVQGAPLTHSIQGAGTGQVGIAEGVRPEHVGVGLYTSTRTEMGPVFLKISQ